jgi:hypothetical protein
MKLVPSDVKNLGFYKKSSNYELLKEFMDSGLKCAELEDFPHSSAAACMSSLRGSIKRYRLFNVRVLTRKGHVFLVRDEL